MLALGAGCILDLGVLQHEIQTYGLSPDRLAIDRHAVVITDELKRQEQESGLRPRIGSTATGTGAAVLARAARGDAVLRAEDSPELAPYVRDVADLANHLVDEDEQVLVEGTQGFGLSLYHSPYYPYVTSRDTTASAFASEVGLGPSAIEDVVLVVRTFPIRVGGNSGPLPNEISWEDVQRESGYPYPVSENTTVTGTTRRVGRFDMELVISAAQVNRPCQIAVNGVDYLRFSDSMAPSRKVFSSISRSFLSLLEKETGTQITMIGNGPRGLQILETALVEAAP